jgi:hypothetical protein
MLGDADAVTARRHAEVLLKGERGTGNGEREWGVSSLLDLRRRGERGTGNREREVHLALISQPSMVPLQR